MLQILDNIDIDEYPKVISKPVATEITIGDLHGNFLKFLYILVRLGIAHLSREDYRTLKTIYYLPIEQISEEILNEFDQIINGITLEYTYSIRLLGDELSDRGSNDYFTLKLIQKLSINRVPFTILLSNHSYYFLEEYQCKSDYRTCVLGEKYQLSMHNLSLLIQRALVNLDDINLIIECCYLPAVKLIDYSFNEDEKSCAIFTHAPVGLEALIPLDLAQTTLEDFLANDNIQKLVLMIDKINKTVQDRLLTKRLTSVHPRIFESIKYILENRNYDLLTVPQTISNYTLTFVHGHDDTQPDSVNRQTLDSCLGKAALPNFSQYELPIMLTSSSVSVSAIFGDATFWENLITSHNFSQFEKLAKNDLLTSEILMAKVQHEAYTDKTLLELVFYYGLKSIIHTLTPLISPEMCIVLAQDKSYAGFFNLEMIVKLQMADVITGLVSLLPRKQFCDLLHEKCRLVSEDIDILTQLMEFRWQDVDQQNEVLKLLKSNDLIANKRWAQYLEQEKQQEGTYSHLEQGFFSTSSSTDSDVNALVVKIKPDQVG